MSASKTPTILHSAHAKLRRILGAKSKPNRKPRHTFLDILPPEIWAMIAEHLTPVERACLALTTVSMLSILGSQHLQRWKDDADENAKAMFLAQFDVHYPKHRLCFDCLVYHRRNELEKKHEFACPRRPYVTQNAVNDVFARLGSAAMLRFRPVHLTMRADRFGVKYGIRLREFEQMCRDAYVDLRHRPIYPRPALWQREFKAAICDTQGTRHLVLRTHGVLDMRELTLRKRSPDRERMWLEDLKEFERGFPSCKHKIKPIAKLVECAYQQDTTDVMRAHCVYCPTDFLFDFAPGRFEITTWTDMGDGISPARDEWRRIVVLPRPGVDFDLEELNAVPCDDLSVRQLFEKAST